VGGGTGRGILFSTKDLGATSALAHAKIREIPAEPQDRGDATLARRHDSRASQQPETAEVFVTILFPSEEQLRPAVMSQEHVETSLKGAKFEGQKTKNSRTPDRRGRPEQAGRA
jgi:hypothetical protein